MKFLKRLFNAWMYREWRDDYVYKSFQPKDDMTVEEFHIILDRLRKHWSRIAFLPESWARLPPNFRRHFKDRDA